MDMPRTHQDYPALLSLILSKLPPTIALKLHTVADVEAAIESLVAVLATDFHPDTARAMVTREMLISEDFWLKVFSQSGGATAQDLSKVTASLRLVAGEDAPEAAKGAPTPAPAPAKGAPQEVVSSPASTTSLAIELPGLSTEEKR